MLITFWWDWYALLIYFCAPWYITACLLSKKQALCKGSAYDNSFDSRQHSQHFIASRLACLLLLHRVNTPCVMLQLNYTLFYPGETEWCETTNWSRMTSDWLPEVWALHQVGRRWTARESLRRKWKPIDSLPWCSPSSVDANHYVTVPGLIWLFQSYHPPLCRSGPTEE